MCGFIGTVNLGFGPALLDRLAHRGPDADGSLVVESAGQRVQLGHRRLAIVDLSPAGRQPMSTDDGRGHLVFNGEIYNHEALRSGLGPREFRGHSDTETLLALLARDGAAALSRLNGIFTLAYLGAADGTLLLARDPFGVKPLYYWQEGDRLAFASEIKPLLALRQAALNEAALASLLSLRFLPSPETLFAGIRRLRPGHVLKVDLAGPLVSSEFPFVTPVHGPEADGPGFDEAVEEYGRLLQRAVERQLMSDVEIGVLLSGGVDSALIAAEARRSAPQVRKAFTVGFRDAAHSEADETAEAAATAAYLGLEHHVERIDYDDFLGIFRACTQIVEEPLATSSMIPMYYLARLAGRHVKVVLSGQGADEPLGGYSRYRAARYAEFLPPSWSAAAQRMAQAAGLRNDSLRRGLHMLAQADDARRFVAAHEVFSAREIEGLIGRRPEPVPAALEDVLAGYGLDRLPAPAARLMALDLRLGLPDDLLLYTDKLTMHFSLECRVPMLDTELVTFVEALPVGYRVGLHRGKRLHKSYAARALPPDIIHRKKKGFLSPTQDWFRDSARLEALLLGGHTKFADRFDRGSVRAVITQHKRGYNRERQLFLLLCLYFWLELFA